MDKVVLRALEKEPRSAAQRRRGENPGGDHRVDTGGCFFGCSPRSQVSNSAGAPAAGLGGSGSQTADGSGKPSCPKDNPEPLPAGPRATETAPTAEPRWSRKAVVAGTLSGTSLLLGFSVVVLIVLFLFLLAGRTGGIGRVADPAPGGAGHP